MFRVLTLTLTDFLVNTIFSRGYGGVHNTHGNSGGVRVFLYISWNYIFQVIENMILPVSVHIALV